jgi:hypothetical protein
MSLTNCKWNKPWQGRCTNYATHEDGMCDEHTGKFCSSCGRPATHGCDNAGSLVCGSPLCDDCRHSWVMFGHEMKNSHPNFVEKHGDGTDKKRAEEAEKKLQYAKNIIKRFISDIEKLED